MIQVSQTRHPSIKNTIFYFISFYFYYLFYVSISKQIFTKFLYFSSFPCRLSPLTRYPLSHHCSPPTSSKSSHQRSISDPETASGVAGKPESFARNRSTHSRSVAVLAFPPARRTSSSLALLRGVPSRSDLRR